MLGGCQCAPLEEAKAPVCFVPTEACPAHACVASCAPLDEQLACCDAVIDDNERILCAAQAHGMSAGIGRCFALEEEYGEWGGYSIGSQTCHSTAYSVLYVDYDTLARKGLTGGFIAHHPDQGGDACL